MDNVDRYNICGILQEKGFDAIGTLYREGHGPGMDWWECTKGGAMFDFCMRVGLDERRMLRLRCELVAPLLEMVELEYPGMQHLWLQEAINCGIAASNAGPTDDVSWRHRYVTWWGCIQYAQDCHHIWYQMKLANEDATPEGKAQYQNLRLCEDLADAVATACLPGTSRDYWGHDKLSGFVADLTAIYARCGKPEPRADGGVELLQDALDSHTKRVNDYHWQVAQKVREVLSWEEIRERLLPKDHFPYGEKKVAEEPK